MLLSAAAHDMVLRRVAVVVAGRWRGRQRGGGVASGCGVASMSGCPFVWAAKEQVIQLNGRRLASW